MNPRRPLRGLVAAILAISVVAVGLAGVSTASAAVNTNVMNRVTVHGKPTAVAITPNSSTVLVTQASDRLSFINPATRTVTRTVTTCSDPTDVAVSPNGVSAYVVCSGEVWKFNIADTISLFAYSPQFIAITPDGTRAYITDGATAQLIVVDLDTGNVITTLPLQNEISPSDVAISPDGTRAITVTSEANIDQFNIDPNSADYNTRIRSDASSPGMTGVVFSPDSTRAYIALGADGNRQVEICVIGDWCGSNSSIDPVGHPLAIAISPDGNTLYTANYQGTVSLLNVVTENPIDNYDLPNDEEPVTEIAAAANDKYIVAAQFEDYSITIIGTTAAAKPARPTALRATRGDGSASVSFTAGSDGGSPITAYQYRIDSGFWVDAAETSSPITISGLTNYTDYRIAVRAVNAIGNGVSSKYVATRPRFTGPVLNSVVPTGPSSIRADFSAVLFGGVNGYRYTVTVVESGTTNVVGSCRTKVTGRFCSVSGLVSGTDYDVSVTHWFRFPADPKARITLPSNTVTVSFPAT